MRRVVNIEDKQSETNARQQDSFRFYDKQTCLLLVQIIEISAGRIGEALYFVNNNGDQIIQHMCSICDCLNRKLSLSKVGR